MPPENFLATMYQSDLGTLDNAYDDLGTLQDKKSKILKKVAELLAQRTGEAQPTNQQHPQVQSTLHLVNFLLSKIFPIFSIFKYHFLKLYGIFRYSILQHAKWRVGTPFYGVVPPYYDVL